MTIVFSSWYEERCKKLAEIWNNLTYGDENALPFDWDAEAVALFLAVHAVNEELQRHGLFTFDNT